jgi:hypothetical protein
MPELTVSPSQGSKNSASWSLACPVQQPYAGVDFFPQSGIYEFGYSFDTVDRTLIWANFMKYLWLEIKCKFMHTFSEVFLSLGRVGKNIN